MNAFKLTAIFLCYLGLVVAQQDQAERFEPEKYFGNWFQIYKTKNIPFEKGGSNIVANYQPKTSNSVYVNNYELLADQNRWKLAQGDAIVEDYNMPYRLGVRFNVLQPRGNYIILHTDYTQISVVYSPEKPLIGAREIKYGWILSRTKNPPQSLIDLAFSIFEAQAGIKRDQFTKTIQQEGVLPPQLDISQ